MTSCISKDLEKYRSEDLKKFLEFHKVPLRTKMKTKPQRKDYIENNELYEEFIDYAKKNKISKIEEKKKLTEIMKRHSTMVNAYRTDLSQLLDQKYNIPFTQQDKEKKKEIFGFTEGHSAINKDIEAKGKGDHMYGINEHDNKMILGSDSGHNLLPCSHKENVNYKKINNKNMIIDDLSTEDIALMSDTQYDIYNKIQKWKKYVEERGARMYHIITPETVDYINNAVKDYLICLEKTILRLHLEKILDYYNE